MAKQENKDGVILTPKGEGDITISDKEMASLGEFLSQVQQWILNHEARLEAIEEFVTETVMGSYDDAKATEAPEAHDDPAWSPESAERFGLNESQFPE